MAEYEPGFSKLSPEERQAIVIAEIKEQITEAATPGVHPTDQIILRLYYGGKSQPVSSLSEKDQGQSTVITTSPSS